MAQLEVFECIGGSSIVAKGIDLASTESNWAHQLVGYMWWALEVYPV